MELISCWQSSLSKIFLDGNSDEHKINRGSTLQGERYCLQLAYYADDCIYAECSININSELKEHIKTYRVINVPVMLANYPWSDDAFLRREAGLYPDLLEPCGDLIALAPKQWQSLWFEVEIPEDFKGGIYPIEVTLSITGNPECFSSNTFELEVIPVQLPKQELIHTEWFHCDCLADYYRTEVFSETHWQIIENYISTAARYGVTMILTPLFTPPLDTEVGGERPTVQLVDVKYENGKWFFDFHKLRRYIDIALKNGINRFEFPHLFTQWGAKATPKIMVTQDGKFIRRFGWDVPSNSPDYVDFLTALLPAVKEYMQNLGLLNNCYFHISDEPQPDQIEQYAIARNLVVPLLEDCHIIDALSDYEFYENGLIKTPIPSNDCVEQFIEKGVEERWTYYCCGQVQKVSNRMVAMPSYRNRIIGMQMFKYDIKGFLHWGYNFWYNRFSRRLLNPFICTDADKAFPTGDAFLVYPAHDLTAMPSIRLMVFAEGLQDMRALSLLAQLTSFEETVSFIDSQLESPLTFSHYPHSAKEFFELRESVNQKIKEIING